jgi:hypothetical protein
MRCSINAFFQIFWIRPIVIGKTETDVKSIGTWLKRGKVKSLLREE